MTSYIQGQDPSTRTKAKFDARSAFPNAVGCIDGTQIRLQSPGTNKLYFIASSCSGYTHNTCPVRLAYTHPGGSYTHALSLGIYPHWGRLYTRPVRPAYTHTRGGYTHNTRPVHPAYTLVVIGCFLSDIRELISVDDAMDDEALHFGPNGALIFCME